MAITYDDYYEDKRTAITYYEKFLKLADKKKDEKDGALGRTALIQATQQRLKELKEKMFFNKED
ncbi:MAG: hypothetical protein ABIL68_07805 [bacterium]